MLALALMMALMAGSSSGGAFADLSGSACPYMIAVPIDAPAHVEVLDGALVGSAGDPALDLASPLSLALSSEPMPTVSGVAGDDRFNSGAGASEIEAVFLVDAEPPALVTGGDAVVTEGCASVEASAGGDEDFVGDDEWAGYDDGSGTDEYAGYDEWVDEGEVPAEEQTGGEEVVDGGAGEEGG